VKENGFYSMICLFQFLYYLPYLTPWFQRFYVIEATWVFLPYFLIRPFFPKTSIRSSFGNDHNKSTSTAITFYYYAAWTTKVFYLWAKHFIGLYVNYLMFLGFVDERMRMLVFGNLIWGSFATTFSMFLHTLRFKGYMPGMMSFSMYVASYMMTFYSYSKFFHVFFEHSALSLLTLAGLFINVYNYRLHDLFQVVLTGAAYGGYLQAF